MFTIQGQALQPLYAQFISDADTELGGLRPPFWLALEGDDGVGKTTTAALLRNFLTQINIPVVVEAEGKFFTDEEDWDDEAFWLERSVRHRDIAKLINAGFSVIQDRSWISTVVYQEDETAVDKANLMYGIMGGCPQAIFVLEGLEGYGRYEVLRPFNGVIIPSVGQIIPIIFVPYAPSLTRAYTILDLLMGTKSPFQSSNIAMDDGEAERVLRPELVEIG